MVKPKNKHSLSHVRHDPAHCLAPGLFRALKRGERKRSKLDVTYDYGDGKRIEWHCCKVSDEAAFCLIQRPYISKTLLTRRISPRGSP